MAAALGAASSTLSETKGWTTHSDWSKQVFLPRCTCIPGHSTDRFSSRPRPFRSRCMPTRSGP
jgi:hypothetical protein